MRKKRHESKGNPGKPRAVEVVEVIIIVLIHLVTIAGLVDVVVQEGQRVAERFRPRTGESQLVSVVPSASATPSSLPNGTKRKDSTTALLVAE